MQPDTAPAEDFIDPLSTEAETPGPDDDHGGTEIAAPVPTKRRRRGVRRMRALAPAEPRIKYEGPASVLLNAGRADDDDEDADDDGDELALLLNPRRIADDADGEEDNAADDDVEAELRALKQQGELKARVFALPRSYAERNPNLTRLPRPQPPGVRQVLDNQAYTKRADLEAFVQERFGYGYYLIEVRRRGKFEAGYSIHHLPPEHAETEHDAPPQMAPAWAYEPPPAPAEPADPVKEARAQVTVMNAVVDAATRLLQVQPQPPAPAPAPTLKERLAELKMLQEMFAPKLEPVGKPDPIEKLAATLESQAVQRIIALTKSDAPAAVAANPVEQGTTAWDFLTTIADHPAVQEGLGALLGSLALGLSNYFTATAPAPTQPTVDTARRYNPSRQPLPAQAVAPPQPQQGVTLEMIFNDIVGVLLNNQPPALAADKLRKLAKVFPPAGEYIKQYARATNDEIVTALIEASSIEPTTFNVPWRDQWLDGLKTALQEEPTT